MRDRGPTVERAARRRRTTAVVAACARHPRRLRAAARAAAPVLSTLSTGRRLAWHRPAHAAAARAAALAGPPPHKRRPTCKHTLIASPLAGPAADFQAVAAVQATKQGMHKVMLTCFTSNAAAQRLYRKLGYSKDETSPDPAVDGPSFAGCVRNTACHICAWQHRCGTSTSVLPSGLPQCQSFRLFCAGTCASPQQGVRV